MLIVKNIIKRLGGQFFKTIISRHGLGKDLQCILMYHRMVGGVPKGLYDRAMFVTADAFEMHIRELCQFFDIVPLETIVQSKKAGTRLCAITFDDGWLDTYEVAFPILQKYQLPATVFIPTAIISTNHCFWFERLMDLARQAGLNGRQQGFIKYFQDRFPSWKSPGFGVKHLMKLTSALKNFPADNLDNLILEVYLSLDLKPPTQRIMIDWGQVSEMGQKGITFGSHGLNHYILPTLDKELKKKEIFESLEILRNKRVPVVPYFSYPNGDWDDESINYLPEAGYRAALTTRLGYNTRETNPFLLNRVGMHEDISHTPALLWYRILQAVLAGSR